MEHEQGRLRSYFENRAISWRMRSSALGDASYVEDTRLRDFFEENKAERDRVLATLNKERQVG